MPTATINVPPNDPLANPEQKQIIDELKVLPEIDPEKEIRRSVDFIKASLLKYPFFKSIVLGISGGQD